MPKNKISSIAGLYYRYKKTSDERLKEFLSRILIVKENANSEFCKINESGMKKMIEKPRGISLTFDAAEIEKTPVVGLKKWKTITYLVKSSSRFFLKPDIGEIFDQIDFDDLHGSKLKAICVNEDYQTLDETEGEHFLMTATLLTSE